MKWNVSFYDTKVMEEIEEWPRGIRAKLARIVELIEDLGPNDVGMPHIKALGQGLFEIRASGQEGIGRAFFCIIKGRAVIILSGFIKKTQKAPRKEIELAQQRMKEVKKS